MANNPVLWDAESSVGAYLSGDLDGLADDARKIGAEIDPAQKRYLSAELSIAEQGSARDPGATVELYVIPSLDGGSTYSYGADALTPSRNHLAGYFNFDAAVTARVDVLENIKLGAGLYKLLIINVTGEAFAGSGNTLKYSLHTEEIQ